MGRQSKKADEELDRIAEEKRREKEREGWWRVWYWRRCVELAQEVRSLAGLGMQTMIYTVPLGEPTTESGVQHAIYAARVESWERGEKNKEGAIEVLRFGLWAPMSREEVIAQMIHEATSTHPVILKSWRETDPSIATV